MGKVRGDSVVEIADTLEHHRGGKPKNHYAIDYRVDQSPPLKAPDQALHVMNHHHPKVDMKVDNLHPCTIIED